MKPCGHAGADGQWGQRNGALTPLPTAPWTSDPNQDVFRTCPHAHTADDEFATKRGEKLHYKQLSVATLRAWLDLLRDAGWVSPGTMAGFDRNTHGGILIASQAVPDLQNA